MAEKIIIGWRTCIVLLGALGALTYSSVHGTINELFVACFCSIMAVMGYREFRKMKNGKPQDGS